jgi:flagellin-like protein
VRKDERAVSPVIATILMVAITVVLAAVLYVMVSGLIGPTGGGNPTWPSPPLPPSGPGSGDSTWGR